MVHHYLHVQKYIHPTTINYLSDKTESFVLVETTDYMLEKKQITKKKKSNHKLLSVTVDQQLRARVMIPSSSSAKTRSAQTWMNS